VGRWRRKNLSASKLSVHPLRAVLLFEGFRQHYPIVRKVQPCGFIEGVSGAVRIQATKFSPLAAFLSTRFAHKDSATSAALGRAN
jgi:hypothetical protein